MVLSTHIGGDLGGTENIIHVHEGDSRGAGLEDSQLLAISFSRRPLGPTRMSGTEGLSSIHYQRTPLLQQAITRTHRISVHCYVHYEQSRRLHRDCGQSTNEMVKQENNTINPNVYHRLILPLIHKLKEAKIDGKE